MLKGKLTPTRFLQGTISKVAEVVGSNIQPIRVYENGIYEVSGDVDGFSPVYVDTPEPKEEQEKTVDIIENGTVEVLPDKNKILSKVTVNVKVPDTSELIEDIIDNSGVLDSTEGTVTKKVEQLIDKAEELDVFMCITDGASLFKGAKSFPSKAVVNFPNVTTVYQAFTYWNTEPIPIVEELTVNAPNISVSNNQACMGQMFVYNNGVKKVILNMPDESQYMQATFNNAGSLEEVVFNFLTKNIKDYSSSFTNCKKLKKITGVLDFSSAASVNWMFASCSNLEDVIFAPNTLSISISLSNSSKLSADSIQSIIDGLATVGTAQTLTLAKAVVLTDVQKKTIQDKGWTLVQ
jgi:hypothetical protein